MTHKILNTNDESDYDYQLTQNRGVRHISENKTGAIPAGLGRCEVQQRSFVFLACRYFNLLDKNLTLIKNTEHFKVMLTRFKTEPEITIKKQIYNTETERKPIIDWNIIQMCENSVP